MIINNRHRSRLRPTKASLFCFVSVVGLLIIWRNNFQLFDHDDFERGGKLNYFDSSARIVKDAAQLREAGNSDNGESLRDNTLNKAKNREVGKDSKTHDDDNHPTTSFIPSHNPKFHFKKRMHPHLHSYINITYNVMKQRRVDFTFTVQKDISSFLDYAIIGMPKTGTTSLYTFLTNFSSPALHKLGRKERCDLVVNDVPLLFNDLYHQSLPKTHHSLEERNVIGIKCPQDISSFTSIQNYASYFSQTKLIIGLRHPIRWFESFYNFQIRNMNKMIPTKKLLNHCVKGSHGVCAWRANISDFLYQLNKTSHYCFGDDRGILQENIRNNITTTVQSKDDDDDDEKCINEQNQFFSLKNVKRVEGNVGKVFIYLIDQLEDEILEKKLIEDLLKFLNMNRTASGNTKFMNEDESNILHIPKISTAGAMDHIPGVRDMTMKNMIDICDHEHKQIRSVLMDKAQKASIWIRRYFLKSDDVYVSSRLFVEKKLEEWMHDPCMNRR